MNDDGDLDWDEAIANGGFIFLSGEQEENDDN